MDSRQILEKIKQLFNVEKAAEEVIAAEPIVEVELAETTPADMPSGDEMPSPEADVTEKVTELEAKIAAIEALLEANNIKLKETEDSIKEKDVKIEELSKQITEKDTLIDSIKTELSKTPASEPIIIERGAVKASLANKMIEKLNNAAKEKGSAY